MTEDFEILGRAIKGLGVAEDALKRIEKQFDALREVVAESRDALWWIVDNRADAGGAAEMILRAYRLLDGASNPASEPKEEE